MIQIFKYNLGFYIKSNIDKPINIIAEQLDIETNEYINPKVIASILPFSGIDYSFITDGKYRISYSIKSNSISNSNINISYLYIESYSTYLNQVINKVKDFLCSSGDCCESKGSDIESANYATNLLLNYYNLATNTTFNSNDCCNPLDSFIRKLSDFLRLDILSDLNSASKNDCLSNTKVSIPTLKKLSSVYFLAMYFYDKWHQYSEQNLSENLEILNDKYQINSIKKCITKQGINFDKAEEIFKKSIESSVNLNSVDKSYILNSNVIEEKYITEIKPSDLYRVTGSILNTEKININIISLPILGKLYYVNNNGTKSEIKEPKLYNFNIYSNVKIIYEYNKLSDTNSDMFLYSIVYGENTCNVSKFNTINFKIYPYGYEEDSASLNLISVKVHNTAKIAFNYYHLFKLLNNPLSLYNTKGIEIITDSSKIIIELADGRPETGFINIEEFNNNVFFKKGNNLNNDEIYKAKVSILYLNDEVISSDILFKIAEDSKFDNIVPIFTVNSVDKDITTLEFPFYNKILPIYADAISMHNEPVSFYFSSNDKDLEVTGSNSAVINNTFPRKRNVLIVAGTNKNVYSKEYIVDNTKADIHLKLKSLDDNVTISFDTDKLGEGVIKNAAWDINVINKESTHSYDSLLNGKDIYLEVYPHDRFRFNEDYLEDIDFIGTFKRIDLSNTSIPISKINPLVVDLERRTPASNIDSLPLGDVSFPVYFIANNLKSSKSTYLSKFIYNRLYSKGILINLANSQGNNPMPTSDLDVNLKYSNFSVSLTQVEKVSPYYEIKANIVSDEPNLADVLIYARLEGKTINGWKTFGKEYFYNKQTLHNSIEESVNGAGLKTDNQGNATFRLAYQGSTGTVYSNELVIKPLSFIEHSNISGIYSTRGGLLVNLSTKAVIGDSFKLDVTADIFGDIFIQSLNYDKQTNNNSVTIPLTFLSQEIIDKGTFYIRVIKNGLYVETVAIDNISNRLSIIPNVSNGNSISNEYQFNINTLDNSLQIFNSTTYEDNYGIDPDYTDRQVYKISDVYVSKDGLSFSKQATNTGDYVDLPLDNVSNLDRFYVKVIVYFVQDLDNGGKVVYKTLESYKILVKLTQ